MDTFKIKTNKINFNITYYELMYGKENQDNYNLETRENLIY